MCDIVCCFVNFPDLEHLLCIVGGEFSKGGSEAPICRSVDEVSMLECSHHGLVGTEVGDVAVVEYLGNFGC
uniref:Uncharacterized protein n=1 Tax=Arundo donax TaxID=35708 RepID=A0A0A9AI92_ARUDO